MPDTMRSSYVSFHSHNESMECIVSLSLIYRAQEMSLKRVMGIPQGHTDRKCGDKTQTWIDAFSGYVLELRNRAIFMCLFVPCTVLESVLYAHIMLRRK